MSSASTPQVFVSYSHKDEAWKDRLVTHLNVLKHQNLIDPWDDRRIAFGDDWKAEIDTALQNARAAVLLISADFLSSDFILGEEVPKLLRQRDEEGLKIFPVIVRPCPWKTVDWLKKIQCRPKDGRALSGGNDHEIDTDLSNIAEEILGAL